MRLKIISSLGLLVTLAGVTGCGDSPTAPNPGASLPPEGMLATVRGKAWVGLWTMGSLIEMGPDDWTLFLSGGATGGGDTLWSFIWMELAHPSAGTFQLDFSLSNRASWMVWRRVGPDTVRTYWGTDRTHTGRLTVTQMDTLKKRVAGGFSFSAYNPDSGVVDVTNGTFNLPLYVGYIQPGAVGGAGPAVPAETARPQAPTWKLEN